tara:strand:+ start:496 stop:1200 length:705 start_codon:yes stop_codon:yes gene_type:complete
MADFLPEVIVEETNKQVALKESETESEDDYVEEVQVKIQEDDIFTTKEAVVSEAKEIVEEPLKIKEVIDKVDKPIKVKKKRVMSEDHKAKLAQAREKALATRRANAARKKEIKQLEKEEEEQKYNSLKNRVQKKVVVSEPIQKETPQEEEDNIKYIETKGVVRPKKERGYTKEELDDAVLTGIMKYDTLRKSRKKKKQEDQSVEAKERKVKEQIANAVNHSIAEDPYNFFDNCY